MQYIVSYKQQNILQYMNESKKQTLPKAQRTRGLSSAYQSYWFRSYPKLKHKYWSNFIFRISTKHQHLDYTWNLKYWPNLAFESRSRFNFITSTKHQWQNSEQTPTSKSWLNFNFKSLTNPCAQTLNKSLALGPNVSSQISNKLLPTWSLASTPAIVTTLTSFELASSHARVTSIKFTKQQSVSQSGSQSVS